MAPLSPSRPLREGDFSFDLPAPSRPPLIPDLLRSLQARLRRMGLPQWRGWGRGGNGAREDAGPHAGETGEGAHELHTASLDERVVVVGNPRQTHTLAGGSPGGAGPGSPLGDALGDALRQLRSGLAHCLGFRVGSLPDNSISTGKYTLLTFLPRNLFEQFHRVAYLYFLALILVNQIPVLAVFGRFISMIPLLSVLGVTAIKDAYEDILRHLADRRENNRRCLIWAPPQARGHWAAPAAPAAGLTAKALLRWPFWHRRNAAVGPGASGSGSEGPRAEETEPQARAPESELQHKDSLLGGGGFREGRWAQVQVGDVLRVSCDEAVPCDMLILCSSDETGRVFVETANLDGETSLKARSAVAEGEFLLRSAVLHGAEDEVKRHSSVSLPILSRDRSSSSGTVALSTARRTASEVVRPRPWEHSQERPSTAPAVADLRAPLSVAPPLPQASTIPLPGTSSASARMQANGVEGTPTQGQGLAAGLSPPALLPGADGLPPHPPPSGRDASPLGGPRGPELGVVVAEPPNRSIYEFSGYWELPRSRPMPLPVSPPAATLGPSRISSGMAWDAALAVGPERGDGSALPEQSQRLLDPHAAHPGSPLPSPAVSGPLPSPQGSLLHAPGPAEEGVSVALGPANMLLRSCVVRNTGWVLGLAVYTGRDCKVVLNAAGAQSKRSRVEAHMNRDMLLLSLLLVLLCLVGAVAMSAWLAGWPDVLAVPYVGARSTSYAGVAGEGAINFFSLLILFQVLVPISLYISIELMRLGQTYFMARDRHMQDARWGAGQGLLCRALNVNEDLGQVRHVLTDKTGTLTQNRMEFHSCSVRGRDMATVLEGARGPDGGPATNARNGGAQPQQEGHGGPEPRQSAVGADGTQQGGPLGPLAGGVAEQNSEGLDGAGSATSPSVSPVHASFPGEEGCKAADSEVKQGSGGSIQALELRPETAGLFVQAVSRAEGVGLELVPAPSRQGRAAGPEVGHGVQMGAEPPSKDLSGQAPAPALQRQAQQEAEEGLDLFLLVLAACNSVVPTVVSHSATTGLVEMRPSTGLGESGRASLGGSSTSTPALLPAASGTAPPPLPSTFHQYPGASTPGYVGQRSEGQEGARGLPALGATGSGREGPALEIRASSTSLPAAPDPAEVPGQGVPALPAADEAALSVEFQGESPDEIALVTAAQRLGCTLLARGSSSVTLDWRAHGAQELQVLGVHEFDSARRRMSVVVRNAQGRAWLLVKGADSAMFPLFAAAGTVSPPPPEPGRQERLPGNGEAQLEGSACDTAEVGPSSSARGAGSPAGDGPLSRQASEGASQRAQEQGGAEPALAECGQEAEVLERTRHHVEAYSCIGLRTLVLGAKELAPSELSAWAAGYQRAQKGLGGQRTTLLQQLAVAVEQGLRCVGATGIEDALQEGVPETLQLLAGAGIKVWMLTGDKPETAESIARSCGLLPPGMAAVGLRALGAAEGADCQEALARARQALEQAPGLPPGHPAQAHQEAPQRGSFGLRIMHNKGEAVQVRNACLIVDGATLAGVLEEQQQELFDLCCQCAVVLCCRVAPMQKAAMVRLITDHSKDLTLAIGDGANDVSMIQTAGIGVGISGEEGRQAVMSSDFAVSQFRFLGRLLLVHGHWNYQRIASMVLYNLYKNAVFVLLLFWFTLVAAFTAISCIGQLGLILYAAVYTAVPTVVVGILDKDLSPATLLRWPALYAPGIHEETYNLTAFGLLMLDVLWQSGVLFGGGVLMTGYGELFAFWSLGQAWLIALTLIVTCHLALDMNSWAWPQHAVIWLSLLATFLTQLVIDFIVTLPEFGSFREAASTAAFWLFLPLLVVASLLPKAVIKYLHQRLRPTDIQIAKEYEYRERLEGKKHRWPRPVGDPNVQRH